MDAEVDADLASLLDGTLGYADGARDADENRLFSYELPDHDLTLAFTLRNQVVEGAELYRGETGEGEQGWPDDVLNLRKLD